MNTTSLRSIGADRPGAVVQIGYLVEDIDLAVARWLDQTNTGPFFRARFDLTGQTFRGEPVASAIEAALGYRDDVLIELVQSVDTAPSVFNELMRQRGPGIHHVMLATADMDADLQRHEAGGNPVVASGFTPGFGRAAFVDTVAEFGHFVEYGEWSDPVLAVIDGFREAHRGWDRNDPVRPYPAIA
jgi:hypothetical protein